jgi:glycosyltransferase involved in cell wall biosynthesis
MDLKVSNSRNRFISWFFTIGVAVFKCQDLIANRWRSWLLEPIGMGEGLGDLPRFALYEYAALPAKQRPDLKDPKGVALWRAWSQKALEPAATGSANQSRWSWIKSAGKNKPYQIATPVTPVSKKPFGVNLFGFAYGELGLGEDLRMAVETCKAAKVPYRIVNIEPGVEIRQNDKGVEKEVLASDSVAPYAINVFCMPGFDTVARIFLKMGDHVFDGHYNVGWWPWELGVWPKSWSSAFDLVDEIWACSEHSFNMYEKATKKPVIAMPLAASVARTKTYSRKHFGLPEKKGLFLYAFDFNSHLIRKNPMAVINAFEKQFAGNKDVCLVLKVMNSNTKDPIWLSFQKQIAKDPRIILIDRTLDRPEVLGLIKACDVYVSPHRAEGFGRTLAEAMLLGKPVVATNYSGNQFFMNPDHTFPVDYDLVPAKKGEYHFVEDGDEAVWANVSIDHLGAQMQAALAAGKQAKFRQNLLAYAQSVFAPQRTAMLMSERLEWIKRQIATQVPKE